MKANEAVAPALCQQAQCEICPLNRVKLGVAVRIKQLRATPDQQYRLREMGFCEEQVIKLLITHTNYICEVCNARLAISEKVAKLIMVEPVPALARVQA